MIYTQTDKPTFTMPLLNDTRKERVIFQDFIESTTDWVIFAEGSCAPDYVNVMSSTLTAPASVALSTGTTGWHLHAGMLRTFTAAQDVSSADFLVVRYFVWPWPSGNAFTNQSLAEIAVYLRDTGENWSIWSAEGRNYAAKKGPSLVGWHEVWLPLGKPYATGCDLTLVNRIRLLFRCVDTSDSYVHVDNVKITFDSVRFVKVVDDSARFVLTFDDGLKTQLLAAARLNYWGKKGVFAVNGYWIDKGVWATDGVTAVMSVDDLRALQEQGHLIANHGYTHASVNAASVWGHEQDILDDYIRQRDWMLRNGFSAGADIIVAGGGSWNRALDVLVRKAGFRQVFLCIGDYVTGALAFHTIPDQTVSSVLAATSFPMIWFPTIFQRAVTPGDIATLLVQCVAKDGLGVVLVGHAIGLTELQLIDNVVFAGKPIILPTDLLKGDSTYAAIPNDTLELLQSNAAVNMKDAGKTTLYTVPASTVAIITRVVIRSPSMYLAGGTHYDFGDGGNCDTWVQGVNLTTYPLPNVTARIGVITSSVVTLSTGHGIATGDHVNAYWAAGSRTGCLASVSVNAVTLGGGTGDPLPTGATAITLTTREGYKIIDNQDLVMNTYHATDAFGVKVITGSTGAATATIDVYGYVYAV
jgi:peptidoglycan/xylan/chitin deacetylase (PgdA/CDA1 family)